MCERRREFELLFSSSLLSFSSWTIVIPISSHQDWKRQEKDTEFLERDQGVFGTQPVGGFSVSSQTLDACVCIGCVATYQLEEGKQSRKSSLSNISMWLTPLWLANTELSMTSASETSFSRVSNFFIATFLYLRVKQIDITSAGMWI